MLASPSFDDGGVMVLTELAQQFLRQSPFAFLTHATFEHVWTDDFLNDVFEENSIEQYTRDLFFSTAVDVLASVVLRGAPSVRASYHEQRRREQLSVSLTSVYNKLNGIEPSTAAALVQRTAQRSETLISRMKAAKPPLLPGFRVKVLDGNCIAATEHRLGVLREVKEAPRPGMSLVLLDPSLDLAIDCFPCENGHEQERALVDSVLNRVEEKDCVIADRNLCTTRMLFGLQERKAAFIIRQHGNCLGWQAEGERHVLGPVDSGFAYEQMIRATHKDGRTMLLRQVTVELDQPTRNGDTELHIVTNLSRKVARGQRIAQLYRERWKIEKLFLHLTEALRCEINTLGYPRAALFGFSLALAAYNVLSTVRAAVRKEHGEEEEARLSENALAEEIGATTRGMMIALPLSSWRGFQKCSDEDFAGFLLEAVRAIDLQWYRRATRGPKKPAPKRRRVGGPSNHVATSKLIAQEKSGESP
jgi:hypothetical protein